MQVNGPSLSCLRHQSSSPAHELPEKLSRQQPVRHLPRRSRTSRRHMIAGSTKQHHRSVLLRIVPDEDQLCSVRGQSNSGHCTCMRRREGNVLAANFRHSACVQIAPVDKSFINCCAEYHARDALQEEVACAQKMDMSSPVIRKPPPLGSRRRERASFDPRRVSLAIAQNFDSALSGEQDLAQLPRTLHA